MLHNHNFPSRCTPITQAIFSYCFTNQLESEFEYTFDNIAEVINDFVEEIKLEKYTIYVHDYGAPVGFRLAVKHPERIQVIITQNANAYEEGLLSSFDPIRTYWKNPSEENKENIRKLFVADFTKYQYVNGTRNPDIISPDSWNLDQYMYWIVQAIKKYNLLYFMTTKII